MRQIILSIYKFIIDFQNVTCRLLWTIRDNPLNRFNNKNTKNLYIAYTYIGKK